MSGPIVRIWRSFGLAVICLAAVFLGVGFLLPDEWHADEQIVVATDTPERALAYITNPSRWPEWTVWNARDIPGFAVASATIQPDGSHTAAWVAESLGRFEMRIAPPEGDDDHKTVAYTLHGSDSDRGSIDGQFDLKKSDDGWHITWTVRGHLKSDPISRWAGLLMVRWMAASDLRNGLHVLQEQLERNGGLPSSAD